MPVAVFDGKVIKMVDKVHKIIEIFNKAAAGNKSVPALISTHNNTCTFCHELRHFILEILKIKVFHKGHFVVNHLFGNVVNGLPIKIFCASAIEKIFCLVITFFVVGVVIDNNFFHSVFSYNIV